LFSPITGIWNKAFQPAKGERPFRVQAWMTTIRFTTEDLDLFQSASHDCNPLHTSDDYARRTAYGGRVVYGVLNAIMALAKAQVLDNADRSISAIECDFFDVASIGLEYSVTVTGQSPSEITVRVSDAHRPVLALAPGKIETLDEFSSQ
jgi:acyl dehydratase